MKSNGFIILFVGSLFASSTVSSSTCLSLFTTFNSSSIEQADEDALKECKKLTNPSDADVQAMISLKVPDTREKKGLMTCLQKKAGIVRIAQLTSYTFKFSAKEKICFCHATNFQLEDGKLRSGLIRKLAKARLDDDDGDAGERAWFQSVKKCVKF